jgi:hypothetical protein
VVERLDPDLAASLLLALDVDLRRRILADENGGEADRTADLLDVLRHLGADTLGESLSIHQDSHGAKR